MKQHRTQVPPPRVDEALRELQAMIRDKFPDAVFEVERSPYRGGWDLHVYMTNMDDRFIDYTGVVWKRLADLRFDHGIRIDMFPHDTSYLQMRANWAREYALRDAAKKSRYRAGDDGTEQ